MTKRSTGKAQRKMHGAPGRGREATALRRHTAMLSAALLQRDAVLKYLLQHVQEQKREIAHAFLDGIEQLVLPTLLRLRGELRGGQRRVLDAAIGHLRELGTPLVERLGRDFAKLSPAEVRVCSLVRQGLSEKEIAAVEGVAASAVRTHGRNIRRKLGLGGSRANLTSFLAPRPDPPPRCVPQHGSPNPPQHAPRRRR